MFRPSLGASWRLAERGRWTLALPRLAGTGIASLDTRFQDRNFLVLLRSAE
jgi:hypothetical protein